MAACPVEEVEEAVRIAIREPYSRPEAIAAAVKVYRKGSAESKEERNISGELKSVDMALAQLKTEEAAAIQAQIAGIRAGASADAYAGVFADIAARRQELEERWEVLSKAIRRYDEDGASSNFPPVDDALIRQALKDANEALSGVGTLAADSCSLVGMLVQKVIPNREGTDVYFVPGAFVASEENCSRLTFQTTCIVCRIRFGSHAFVRVH